MKGIILAGGLGTRLYPATLAMNKQLMPIYDKPMIYYPLSVLMLAEIRDLLIISTVEHLPFYQRLLGDGSAWGIRLEYIAQEKPVGLAHAFVLGREFIGTDRVALILGDNLFYGQGLSAELAEAASRPDGATVFAYHVNEPNRYGVLKFDDAGQPTDIVEKPDQFLSNWAVTGLYFYDNEVLEIAADLRPSARGELEISDINRHYLRLKRLRVVKLGRGYAWLDTGTHEALLEAAEFVRSVQHRQGLLVGCPEEVAYLKGFITAASLRALATKYHASDYGRYLQRIVD
jgi:glucose-1-phosphate thymidylyltransferase